MNLNAGLLLAILSVFQNYLILSNVLAQPTPILDSKNDIQTSVGGECKYNISVFVYDENMFPFRRDDSTLHEGMYSAEGKILSEFSKSPCRTTSPDTADFFLVPVAVTEVVHRGLGRTGADFNSGFDFLYIAYQQISTELPYFNRSQGADHIWVISHDIGSCLAPPEILKGIFLQHNGDKVHNKDCLHTYLNKSFTPPHAGLLDRATLPCYNPAKDIVVPPYIGDRRERARWKFDNTGERPVLALFRGGVHEERCYSNGIRQWLVQNASGLEGFSIHLDYLDPFEYHMETLKATFCLSPGGWVGWSQRTYQAMSAGCIPVLFEAQNVAHAFQDLINYDRLAVLIASAQTMDATDLKNILISISTRELVQMKLNLKLNWKYFTYATKKNDEKEPVLNMPQDAFRLILLSLRRRLNKSSPTFTS